MQRPNAAVQREPDLSGIRWSRLFGVHFEFLRRFYLDDLPFSQRSLDIVKEIIVLEETGDEVLTGDRDVLELACLVVPVVEGNLTVVDRIDPAVADRDAMDVASEVGEHHLPVSCGLAVDDPLLLPDLLGGVLEEASSA